MCLLEECIRLGVYGDYLCTSHGLNLQFDRFDRDTVLLHENTIFQNRIQSDMAKSIDERTAIVCANHSKQFQRNDFGCVEYAHGGNLQNERDTSSTLDHELLINQ